MIPPEPRDTDRRTMPKSNDPAKYLPAMAREAAKKRRPPKAPLLWSEALAEAPWSKEMPGGWEREFRTSYAQELCDLGYAEKAKTLPKEQRSEPDPDRDRTTNLKHRTFRAKEPELDAMDAVVSDLGDKMTWNTWARRVLSAAVEAHWKKK